MKGPMKSHADSHEMALRRLLHVLQDAKEHGYNAEILVYFLDAVKTALEAGFSIVTIRDYCAEEVAGTMIGPVPPGPPN